MFVLLDAQQLGATKAQAGRGRQLESQGVQVRIGRGSSVDENYRERGREFRLGGMIKGKIHGKSALIQDPGTSNSPGVTECLIGSANWSDSTGANVEFNARIRQPSPEFVSSWLEEFNTHFGASLTVSEVLEGNGGRGGTVARRE